MTSVVLTSSDWFTVADNWSAVNIAGCRGFQKHFLHCVKVFVIFCCIVFSAFCCLSDFFSDDGGEGCCAFKRNVVSGYVQVL